MVVMVVAPCITLVQSERRKYLAEGSHRRLYSFSPDDDARWPASGAAVSRRCRTSGLAARGRGGHAEGGKIYDLTGVASAFTPDYAPEWMLEMPRGGERDCRRRGLPGRAAGLTARGADRTGKANRTGRHAP